MINSFHNDIAGNVEADFVYVFQFVLDYLKNLAIYRNLPRYDRFVYEW